MIAIYWINEVASNGKDNYLWKSFYADNDSDIKNLPTSSSLGFKQKENTTTHNCCAMGSECLVLKSSSLYILGSDDKWNKIGGSSGSSSGSGSTGDSTNPDDGVVTEDEIEPVPEEDILDLFK